MVTISYNNFYSRKTLSQRDIINVLGFFHKVEILHLKNKQTKKKTKQEFPMLSTIAACQTT